MFERRSREIVTPGLSVCCAAVAVIGIEYSVLSSGMYTLFVINTMPALVTVNCRISVARMTALRCGPNINYPCVYCSLPY